jgi:hypothetical protein
MPAGLFASIAVAVLSVAAAQEPVRKPPDTSAVVRPSKTEARVFSVTLTGCLKGSRFVPTPASLRAAPGTLAGVTALVLQGPRGVLRPLTRDHTGHEETITGVVIIPPQPADATIDDEPDTRTRAGGSGVRDGGGDGSSPDAEGLNGPIRIRVQSARHVADRCVLPP